MDRRALFDSLTGSAFETLRPDGVFGHLFVALSLGLSIGQDIDLDLGFGAGVAVTR